MLASAQIGVTVMGMESREENPRLGWVLYDDSCGFCRRWVRFWAATLRRRGYDIVPLQSKWARQRLHLSGDALVDDLRLLLVDGVQVQGADVYRHVMRTIWWAYPFFLMASAPGLRTIFDRSYRAFATHRFRFSRACGLAGPADSLPGHEPDFDLSDR